MHWRADVERVCTHQARTRFAEQRKVDIETFGGTGIARRNNYGRGRGRGGRRGGGGGRQGVRTYKRRGGLIFSHVGGAKAAQGTAVTRPAQGTAVVKAAREGYFDRAKAEETTLQIRAKAGVGQVGRTTGSRSYERSARVVQDICIRCP